MPSDKLHTLTDDFSVSQGTVSLQAIKNHHISHKTLFFVFFSITNAHIIGSGTELEIMVIVENKKEDAFNTKLFVTLPPGVSFRSKAGEKSVRTTLI